MTSVNDCFVHIHRDGDEQIFYENDPNLPVYACYDDPLQPSEVLDIVLNLSETDHRICQVKPVSVSRKAVFVINSPKLRSLDDVKADDSGSWIHKGKPIRHYRVSRTANGTVYGTNRCDRVSDENTYSLTRTYYHHAHTPIFRRILFIVHGKKNL